MRRRLLYFLSLSLAAGLGFSAAQANSPDVLSSVTTGGWDPGFDPAYCYGAGCDWILNNTTEALFRHKDTDPGEIEPLLAAVMPTAANGGISKDGKTYTIKLKAGLKFSDGTPMTADDVAYSIKRMLVYAADIGPSTLLTQPLLGSGDAVSTKTSWALLDASVQAKDKSTVVFKLAQPFSPFLTILAFPSFGVIEKAAAVKAGDWSGTSKDWQSFVGRDVSKSLWAKNGPIASGPFVIQRYDPDKLLVLGRSDKYWRAPAKFSRVILQNIPDDTTRLQLLKTGDADMAERAAVPPALLGQLSSLPSISVNTTQPDGNVYGFFFTFKLAASSLIGSGKLDGKGIPANFFTDKNVRQGFASSFDYQGYIKQVLQGRAVQANTLNVQGILGYSAQNPKYTFDKAAATAAFKKAFGGQLWAQGFTLNTVVRADNTLGQQLLDLMKRGVESLNPKFHINVQEVQRAQLNDQLSKHQIPLLAGAWGVDYPDPDNMFQPLVASDGYYGTKTLYNNPAVDAAIARGRVETDPAARAKLYQSLAKTVFDDVGLIPVYSLTGLKVQNKRITGRTVGDEYYYDIVKK